MFCRVDEGATCALCASGWNPAWALLQQARGFPREGCVFCGALRTEGGVFFHTDCYRSWSGRADLATRGVDMLLSTLRTARWAAVVYDDGLVAVTVTIAARAANDADPTFAWLPAVHLYETGEHVEIPSGVWARWVAEGEAPAGAFDPSAFDRARARLRSVLPTASSIADKVDWAAKRQQILDDDARRGDEEVAARARQSARRRAFEQARAEGATNGVSCPRCSSRDIRVMDVGEGRDSYFVCRGCGRSWAPEIGNL